MEKICVCVSVAALGLSLHDNMLSASLVALHLHPAGIPSDAELAVWVCAAGRARKTKS